MSVSDPRVEAVARAIRDATQATMPSLTAPNWRSYVAEAQAAIAALDHITEEKRLWLWKNFVNGRPEYWAFDNPFPCFEPGGDPITLGQPCGWAILKPSHNGRPDVVDADVERAIARAQTEEKREEPSEAMSALQDARMTLTKTATGRIGSDELTIIRSFFDSAVRNIDKALVAMRAAAAVEAKASPPAGT